MIRNGYYYPVEMYRDLKRNENGKVVGRAQIGISFGNRTAGKTVGHGIQMIKNFTERGESFMLLSRTDKQLRAGYLENWLRNKILNVRDDDGVIEEFLSLHDIKFSNNIVTANDAPFAYCEAISMSTSVKDMGAYMNCTHIIMDECVQTGERVLFVNRKPAMQRIFEIMQTVARGREYAVDTTNLVFIANVSDRDNWLFNDLGINSFVRRDTKYTCQKGIVVEIVMNENAKNEIEQSTIGKIMMESASGKAYYEAAQENKFQDNEAFVAKIGLDFRKLIVQLAIAGRYLGVFVAEESFHIALIEKSEKSPVVTCEVAMHNEEMRLELFGGWADILSKHYESGTCTFQTLEAKGMFLEYIKYR